MSNDKNYHWELIKPVKAGKKGRKKTRYYLAYGSNLNLTQMADRCPEAKRRGWGRIENYELLYKGSKTGSYLTIEPKEGAYVPVGVFSVTPSDEERLDRYEGYPRFYYKKEMKIRIFDEVLQKKRTVYAFIYIMHEDRKLGIPSIFYVQTCLEGYMDFNFDFDLLEKAEEKSYAAERGE